MIKCQKIIGKTLLKIIKPHNKLKYFIHVSQWCTCTSIVKLCVYQYADLTPEYGMLVNVYRAGKKIRFNFITLDK